MGNKIIDTCSPQQRFPFGTLPIRCIQMHVEWLISQTLHLASLVCLLPELGSHMIEDVTQRIMFFFCLGRYATICNHFICFVLQILCWACWEWDGLYCSVCRKHGKHGDEQFPERCHQQLTSSECSVSWEVGRRHLGKPVYRPCPCSRTVTKQATNRACAAPRMQNGVLDCQSLFPHLI